MADRCLLRAWPQGLERPFLVDIDEWTTWEPCSEPVVFKTKEPLAPGGWLMLCAKHVEGMDRFKMEKPHGLV